jgi:hypothetical protein
MAITAALGLPCATRAQAAPVHYRYMGEASCGAWPKQVEFEDIKKVVPLNWVLGFLSKASVDRGVDLMANVDVASVSAWMDNYCATHPLDSILTGAFELERELATRAAPPPSPRR